MDMAMYARDYANISGKVVVLYAVIPGRVQYDTWTDYRAAGYPGVWIDTIYPTDRNRH